MLYKAGEKPRTVKDQLAHMELVSAEPGWFDSPSGAKPAAAAPAASPLVPSSTALSLEFETFRTDLAMLTAGVAVLRAELDALKAASQAPAPFASLPGVMPAAAAEPDATAEPDAVDDSEEAALYRTPVSTIIGKLKGSSRATLTKLEAYERANPRPEGPRKSLLDAVAIAMKGLL